MNSSDGGSRSRRPGVSTAAEATRRRLPNLVMVGLGKAGTTSLFYYLSQHRDICSSDVKEIQYFRPLTDGDGRLGSPNAYAAHFSHCTRERYRLEASPQYLHGGQRVIAAMQELLLQPKIIITLRDPVDRMWSTFRFAKARGTLPGDVTFETYVARCEEVHACDDGSPANRLFRTMAGGVYGPAVKLWLDAFGADGRVVFFEQLVQDAPAVVRGLCRWLELDDSGVDQFDYTTQNATRPARNMLVHRVAMAANMERVFGSHRRLKAPLRRIYYLANGRTASDRIPPDVRESLRIRFAPANAQLRAELERRGYCEFPRWLAVAAAG